MFYFGSPADVVKVDRLYNDINSRFANGDRHTRCKAISNEMRAPPTVVVTSRGLNLDWARMRPKPVRKRLDLGRERPCMPPSHLRIGAPARFLSLQPHLFRCVYLKLLRDRKV